MCIIVTVLIALTPGLSAQDIEKININKASVEEFTRLKRIGAKIAQRIVEYQEKNGPFETPEDITKVKGIGSKTFELNKDRITVKAVPVVAPHHDRIGDEGIGQFGRQVLGQLNVLFGRRRPFGPLPIQSVDV